MYTLSWWLRSQGGKRLKLLCKALRALYQPYPKPAPQGAADNPQRHLNSLWPWKSEQGICPSYSPPIDQAQLPTEQNLGGKMVQGWQKAGGGQGRTWVTGMTGSTPTAGSGWARIWRSAWQPRISGRLPPQGRTPGKYLDDCQPDCLS